jgi:SAM-dependent methyltransferase
MDKVEAEKILRSAEYWHYPFDLPWGKTSPHKVDHAERHFKRRRHFFEPLLGFHGGTLAGLRVLDLGCCQGFWSFESLKAGATSTFGIDSSAAFIQEAKALGTILDMNGASFLESNLEDDAWWQNTGGSSDITLFLGLFYHLVAPVSVLRRAMKLTRRTIVVDTEVISGEQPWLSLRPRDTEEPTTKKSRPVSNLRMVPTPAALAALLIDGGFTQMVTMKTATEMPIDYTSGVRVSIIARRA